MTRRRAGLEGVEWATWDEAVAESVALAEWISRTPAHYAVGFAIKLRALACQWEGDLEDHQLTRLCDLAHEMGRAEFRTREELRPART